MKRWSAVALIVGSLWFAGAPIDASTDGAVPERVERLEIEVDRLQLENEVQRQQIACLTKQVRTLGRRIASPVPIMFECHVTIIASE